MNTERSRYVQHRFYDMLKALSIDCVCKCDRIELLSPYDYKDIRVINFCAAMTELERGIPKYTKIIEVN